MLTNTKRVFRAGFLNFWRNGYVSFAAVLVMTITLFVMGMIIFTSVLLQTALAQIKDKVDINVYFITEAPEGDIMTLRQSLQILPQVKEVTYTSREEALEAFKKRNENDELTLQALEELGENPLQASLNIRAKDPTQYAEIAEFLKRRSELASDSGLKIIDKVNYYQNKPAIDKLTAIIAAGQKLGSAVLIFMGAIALLVIFNTIRLTIYSSRDEISVMRLVGANNSYIRGPFIVEGLMYGIVGAVVVLIMFYPLTYWLGGSTANFFGGINIFAYYLSHFWQFSGIILLTGMGLGIISSFLAMKRYLKV